MKGAETFFEYWRYVRYKIPFTIIFSRTKNCVTFITVTSFCYRNRQSRLIEMLVSQNSTCFWTKKHLINNQHHNKWNISWLLTASTDIFLLYNDTCSTLFFHTCFRFEYLRRKCLPQNVSGSEMSQRRQIWRLSDKLCDHRLPNGAIMVQHVWSS